MRTALSIAGCWICFGGLLVASLWAEDASPSDKADKSAGEPTKYTVAKGPFQIEASLDGVFEARETEEVVLVPESWSDWVVREAVPQGTAVKAGDVILKFDSRKLEEAIKDLEAAQKVSELTQRQLEADLGLQEKTQPLDMRTAERAKRTADEDLKHFLEKDRDLQTRSADFQLKQNEERLAYVEEELKQLEKMYRGGDLREETEEIILRRQRDEVEAARFGVERAKALREESLRATLPREEDKLHDTAERAAIDLEKSRLTAPIGITKTRLELEKLRTENSKTIEKLEKLRRDLALMNVKAPRAGIVYYGACKLGIWTTGSSVASELQPGHSVQAHEVLVTIVNPESIAVRAVIPEAQLHLLHPGLAGRVTATAFPSERLSATLGELPNYPDVSGKFTVRLALDAGRLAKLEHRPAPGMTCSVKLVPYKKTEALAIPAKAVFSDEGADSPDYVFVESSGGKPERREVHVGQRSGEQAEITDGLHEKDKVLLKRPEGM
jgi:HlyD family secretion protein